MNTDDVVGAVIDSLNQQDVPYMIVRSPASCWLRGECELD
jgi:hypothetical protein